MCSAAKQSIAPSIVAETAGLEIVSQKAQLRPDHSGLQQGPGYPGQSHILVIESIAGDVLHSLQEFSALLTHFVGVKVPVQEYFGWYYCRHVSVAILAKVLAHIIAKSCIVAQDPYLLMLRYWIIIMCKHLPFSIFL